jgi:ribonuclease R
MLQEHEGAVQPIFRRHDPPDEERLEELARRIEVIVTDRGLPARFRWRRAQQSLGDYLRGLPDDAAAAPLVEAISRQAIMVNVRSQFSAEPGPHFGIGADVYARFSAPMREIVGVFVHKELWELRGAVPMDAKADEALQAEVIDAANRSRQLQRDLTHAANGFVIDQLLQPDLDRPRQDRPRRPGTVMGMRGDKLYVKLDDPPVEVKVYFGELEPPATADDLGARMVQGSTVLARLGDRVHVAVTGRHAKSGRWLLSLTEKAAGASSATTR